MAKATTTRPEAPRTPVELAALQLLTEDRIQSLENRLAALEQRLDPNADYLPSEGYAGEGVPGVPHRVPENQDDPLNELWARYHNDDDGTRLAPRHHARPDPVLDLMNGHLQPETWAQLCDCLAALADEINSLGEDIDDLKAARGPMHTLVANLSRAIMSSSPRSAHDVAEAFVLETVTRQLADSREKRARQLQMMWRFIELWSDNRYAEADRVPWRMVLLPVPGHAIEDGDLVITRASQDA